MNNDRAADDNNSRRSINARNLLITRDVMESKDPPEEFLPKSCGSQTTTKEILHLLQDPHETSDNLKLGENRQNTTNTATKAAQYLLPYGAKASQRMLYTGHAGDFPFQYRLFPTSTKRRSARQSKLCQFSGEQ